MKRLCLIVAMCVMVARMFAQEDVVVKDTLNHWLTYGIPGQTVMDSLGIPDLEGVFMYWESDGNYHNQWDYFSLGLTIRMVSDTIGSPSKVEYIKITDDDSLITTTTFVTTKGIRIGTPKKQVLDLYEALQVLDLEEKHWDKPYDVRYIVPLDRLWIGDPYEATIIEFYEDKVFEIEMGYFSE